MKTTFILSGVALIMCGFLLGHRFAIAEEPATPTIVVTMRDGSVARGGTDIKTLELETVFGTLSVPVEKILRIRFGRFDDGSQKSRIEELIAALGSNDFETRENAQAALAKFGTSATKLLQAASHSSDPEVVSRVTALLEQLASAEETQPALDEIETTEFFVRGNLRLTTLTVVTASGTLKIERKNLLTARVTPSGELAWMTEGLVAHWKLDEANGVTARDDGPNKLDGKLDGYDAGTRRWVEGVSRNALSFNGKSNCVVVGSDDVLNPKRSDWTVSVWIKTSGATAVTGQVIIGKNAGGATGGGGDRDLPLKIENGCGCVVFSVSGPRFGVEVIGTTKVVDAQWHHVVGMRVGKKLSLYVDGKLEGEKTDAAVPDEIVSNQPLYLGRNDLWDGWALTRFNGLMDDVRIYSRALSPEEIKTLANSRK